MVVNKEYSIALIIRPLLGAKNSSIEDYNSQYLFTIHHRKKKQGKEGDLSQDDKLHREKNNQQTKQNKTKPNHEKNKK